VLLIRKWAMRALPGVRLTLVSSDSHSPYSGMLPGLIAGHYTSDEIHVDLRLLCSWAGVRFIEETMLDLDLVSRQIQFKNRPPMSFDVCSLDTGSTPDLSVKGASVASTPVKPVYNFHKRWQRILERVNASDAVSMSIGVVGSGAGGFELITAMRHALPNTLVKCHWFLRGKLPLRGRPSKVGELAKRSAETQGIEVIAET
jgi:selenide,water dikinase